MNGGGISSAVDDASASSRNMPCGGGWLSQCCKFIRRPVLCPIQKEKLLPTIVAVVGVTEAPPSLGKCHELVCMPPWASGTTGTTTSRRWLNTDNDSGCTLSWE